MYQTLSHRDRIFYRSISCPGLTIRLSGTPRRRLHSSHVRSRECLQGIGPLEQKARISLIDVSSYTIVGATQNDEDMHGGVNGEYVALSYVWGRASSLRLLQSNQDELMNRGGLKNHWEEIPESIRDAIALTKQLRIQYLWVDEPALFRTNKLILYKVYP